MPTVSQNSLPSIRSAVELKNYLAQQNISWEAAYLPPFELFTESFPLRIPYHYANLIHWQDPTDPLRLMVIPDVQELQPKAYELSDPIGDHPHEVVPGLIHRYPDRCLLLLTSYCLVHCRFCFRREVVGKVRPVQFQAIQKYLTEHTEVKEIIFSGGDPFTFPVGFLQSIVSHLRELDHIKTWRFHTRVPSTDPGSVSDEWIEQLEQLQNKLGKKIVIVIHINHAREVTPEFLTLVSRLQKIGCLILSQTVLLKGVNDQSMALEDLFRLLTENNVKPYYLHHLDQVYGSHHFRISIEQGKEIFRSLRGNVSGICLPEYVLDLPGGYGKVPVMWLERLDQKTYKATTFDGKEVEYVDHAKSEIAE